MSIASPIQRLLLALLTLSLSTSIARAGLTHRYSFSDPTPKDSVGKIDGKLKGAAKIADGKLVLANTDKTSADAALSYLDFGSSLLPKTASVSLVFWFTAKDQPAFTRVLDFGSTDNGEGQAFIYFTPHQDQSDKCRAAITATDAGGKTTAEGDVLDDGKEHMVVIAIDGTAKKIHLFIDGKEPAAAEDLGDNTLDKVKPTNNWLGRSQFDINPGFTGSINEFRVYDEALSAAQVTEIQKAGADKLP